MSGFDFNGANFQAPQGQTQRRNNGANGDKPKSKLWLNAGFYADVPTLDGEGTERVFISIRGVALDDLEIQTVREGASDRAVAFADGKNWLIENLKAGAMSCEPGTGQPVHGLSLEVYKAAEQVATRTDRQVMARIAPISFGHPQAAE